MLGWYGVSEHPVVERPGRLTRNILECCFDALYNGVNNVEGRVEVRGGVVDVVKPRESMCGSSVKEGELYPLYFMLISVVFKRRDKC